MKAQNSRKQKHMTLPERIEIQIGLERRQTIKAIAERIDKDPTTVSKEIKKHIFKKPTPSDESDVVHIDSAGNIVDNPVCPHLLKSPYVCNGCDSNRRRCGYDKQFYHAKKAQMEYEELLVEARSGIPLTKESFWEMNDDFTAKVKKGQRLYHISQSSDLGVSQATMYRYVPKGYLGVNAFDFPRMVKFKKRKKNPAPSIPRALKQGRTYEDFKIFLNNHDITHWVEMDTVIGNKKSKKVILTFNFTFCNFIFGILLDNKTVAEVTNKVNNLKRLLNANNVRFGSIIPLLLTDNGSEFSNIWTFINDLDGNPETDLFFCDPNQAQQKARIEKNHTLLRDIVPKGESFDDFTQETVNLIFSHINGVKRKALNEKSAYEIFTYTFDTETAQLLGIGFIHPNHVIQSPKLLK